VVASRHSAVDAPVSFEISSGFGNRSPGNKRPLQNASFAKATTSDDESAIFGFSCRNIEFRLVKPRIPGRL
jgi:hypothetical protein